MPHQPTQTLLHAKWLVLDMSQLLGTIKPDLAQCPASTIMENGCRSRWVTNPGPWDNEAPCLTSVHTGMLQRFTRISSSLSLACMSGRLTRNSTLHMSAVAVVSVPALNSSIMIWNASSSAMYQVALSHRTSWLKQPIIPYVTSAYLLRVNLTFTVMWVHVDYTYFICTYNTDVEVHEHSWFYQSKTMVTCDTGLSWLFRLQVEVNEVPDVVGVEGGPVFQDARLGVALQVSQHGHRLSQLPEAMRGSRIWFNK